MERRVWGFYEFKISQKVLLFCWTESERRMDRLASMPDEELRGWGFGKFGVSGPKSEDSVFQEVRLGHSIEKAYRMTPYDRRRLQF